MLIKFKSFDPVLLDMCLKSLMSLLANLDMKATLAKIPTQKHHTVIQSSPHIDKRGKNSFSHVTHVRTVKIAEQVTNKVRQFIIDFAKTKQIETSIQIKTT